MKILKDIGKILLLSIVLASGLVVSRILLLKLDVFIQRFPQQADENTAIYYLLIGSVLLASGWYYLFKGIGGSKMERILISSVFMLVGFSLGVTIESAIYSDVESYHMSIILLLLPMILYSIIITIITDTKKLLQPFNKRLLTYFKTWSKKSWLKKILLAIISFPIIYFIFGIIASPFVTNYYSKLVGGLQLPDPGTIIGVQLIRSILFFAITIPMIINWTSTKTKLIISLSIAHFVMVFAYDIYLAIVMPVELVIIHGFEIAADSFIYSWILVKIVVHSLPVNQTLRTVKSLLLS
jgi:hypothetical protein